MVLLGNEDQVEARFGLNHVSVHLEIVLVSVEDKCTVCTERTIGSEIILDAPIGTPR
jgi:hypothetical protein